MKIHDEISITNELVALAVRVEYLEVCKKKLTAQEKEEEYRSISEHFRALDEMGISFRVQNEAIAIGRRNNRRGSIPYQIRKMMVELAECFSDEYREAWKKELAKNAAA